MPIESMSHLVAYPSTFLVYGWIYATKYNFFGLFSISPFLLIGLLSIVDLIKSFSISNIKHYMNIGKKHSENLGERFIRNNLMLGWGIASTIYICVTLKISCSYSPSTYDVRYFYPVVVLLAFITAIKFDSLLSQVKNKNVFIIAICTFGLMSLAMGFVGLLNAFGPYMTSERRIWVDIFDVYKIFSMPEKVVYDAIAPNRENILFPLVMVAIGLTIAKFLSFTKSLSNAKNKRTLSD